MNMQKNAKPEASQGRHAAVEPSGGDEQVGLMPEKQKGRRGRKALKVFGIMLAVLVGLVVVAYGAGCVYFMDRFFPNTAIGAFDVSLKTSEEAHEVLQAGIDGYRLDVAGRGLKFSLTAEDAGLVLDEDAILAQALEDRTLWTWPLELQKQHDASDVLAATYDKDVLANAVQAKVDAFNEDATEPENAKVAFDEAKGAYQVVPEQLGTALDASAVAGVVGASLEALAPTATIGQGELLKPPVLADDPNLAVARDAANGLLTADFTLMMGSSEAARIGPELISSWIGFDEDHNPSLDEGLMNAWIEEFAAGCNTIGSERTFTREDGKVVTVAGGTYGWSVDQAALVTLLRDSIANGQTGEVEAPVLQSAAAFSGAGERDWAGYVDVDLSEQYARFYNNEGAVIWETAIITGVPNAQRATPTGVYSVNSKASPTTLNTYEGKKEPKKTVVQYWMPFVGNLIGLHDAWWQPGFGGTMYRDGYGSHGCVNLPSAKAQELYGILAVGDVVVVHW